MGVVEPREWGAIWGDYVGNTRVMSPPASLSRLYPPLGLPRPGPPPNRVDLVNLPPVVWSVDSSGVVKALEHIPASLSRVHPPQARASPECILPIFTDSHRFLPIFRTFLGDFDPRTLVLLVLVLLVLVVLLVLPVLLVLVVSIVVLLVRALSPPENLEYLTETFWVFTHRDSAGCRRASKTRLRKPPSTFRVEESTSPRRVLHF